MFFDLIRKKFYKKINKIKMEEMVEYFNISQNCYPIRKLKLWNSFDNLKMLKKVWICLNLSNKIYKKKYYTRKVFCLRKKEDMVINTWLYGFAREIGYTAHSTQDYIIFISKEKR